MTVFSKSQSYLLTSCFILLSLGCSWAKFTLEGYFYVIPLLTTPVFFMGLIAALVPQRQTLQDWARYRQERLKTGTKYSLVQDLIWGEKSPALLAIALNLGIVAAFFMPAIFLKAPPKNWFPMFSGLFLHLNFILVCAILYQLLLLSKMPKGTLWALTGFATLSFFPPIMLAILNIAPGKDGGGLWLLTIFAWHAAEEASALLIFQAVLIQLTCFSFLTWQFTRQLKKTGESTSKALLGKSAVLN